MTGKALVMKALRHEPTPAVPWLPYTGIHVAKLNNYTATQVLLEADKLYACLMTAAEHYEPDGMPIVFDLQIEAEILGCELMWAEKNPPSVMTHPLADQAELPVRALTPNDGRLPIILDVMRRMKKSVGETTALYGLVCGPLTLASHLRGMELFMDMVRNPDSLHVLIDRCAKFALQVADFYIAAGMDVIAVVDPFLSQISPKHFQAFFSGSYTAIFDELRTQSVFSSFFVCGDASRVVEGMCQTGPDSISVDENVRLAAAKQVTDRYNITIAGNIPLTTVMLDGTPQDNVQFVVDLLDTIDGQNFILAPGCDLPYDIPEENVLAIGRAVRDPEGTRRSLVR